jgi:hypothetical protein
MYFLSLSDVSDDGRWRIENANASEVPVSLVQFALDKPAPPRTVWKELPETDEWVEHLADLLKRNAKLLARDTTEAVGDGALSRLFARPDDACCCSSAGTARAGGMRASGLQC